MSRLHVTRRGFLGGALALSAGAAAHLWIPRWARATPSGPIKRVIVVNVLGGIRWSATFDGQNENNEVATGSRAVELNPWGVAAWGRANAKRKFHLARQLCQKPSWVYAQYGAGPWDKLAGVLVDDDPQGYRLTSPTLQQWSGAPTLPSFVALADEVAMVRVTNNLAGVDVDHGSAGRTLQYGSVSGQTSLTTAFHDALRRQLGPSSFEKAYALPACVLGVNGSAAAFAAGVDQYAGARPLSLDLEHIPGTDIGATVSAWGRQAEVALDDAEEASLEHVRGLDVSGFINDKAHEAYAGVLADPAIHVVDAGKLGSALGASKGGDPLTNKMLAEVFALSSALTPAEDIALDLGSQKDGTPASYDLGGNVFGWYGATAIRLLQKGAPIVSIATSGVDSHAFEVFEGGGYPATSSTLISLSRMLSGLAFALKNTIDPSDPSRSLWESTVVVVTSEFGREEPESKDGFAAQNSGGGSGHGGFCSWPLMGGPVAPGALFDGGDKRHQNCVFTSILQGMGVSKENSPYLSFDEFPPVAGLFPGVV